MIARLLRGVWCVLAHRRWWRCPLGDGRLWVCPRCGVRWLS
jgi:hypothetical protein